MTLAILAAPIARDLTSEFPGLVVLLQNVRSTTEQFYLTPHRDRFMDLGDEEVRILGRRSAVPLALRGRLILIQHGTAAFVPPPLPLTEHSQAYQLPGVPWPWALFADVPGTRRIGVLRNGELITILKSQFDRITDLPHNAHFAIQFAGHNTRADELGDAR